jgi:hypothetical protein
MWSNVPSMTKIKYGMGEIFSWWRRQRWFSKRRFTRHLTTWRGCLPNKLLLKLHPIGKQFYFLLFRYLEFVGTQAFLTYGEKCFPLITLMTFSRQKNTPTTLYHTERFVRRPLSGCKPRTHASQLRQLWGLIWHLFKNKASPVKNIPLKVSLELKHITWTYTYHLNLYIPLELIHIAWTFTYHLNLYISLKLIHITWTYTYHLKLYISLEYHLNLHISINTKFVE